MAIPDADSAVGHSFGLEIDGIVIKHIQQVEGLRMEQDEIELRQNTADGKFVVKKLPGRPKSGQVTLMRGLTGENSFDSWIKDARFGRMKDARKGAAIIVYDYEGNPIKRYLLTNAWPKTLEIGTLKAGDPSVLTERLVVTYEELSVE
jgi:phage tail-like protein